MKRGNFQYSSNHPSAIVYLDSLCSLYFSNTSPFLARLFIHLYYLTDMDPPTSLSRSEDEHTASTERLLGKNGSRDGFEANDKYSNSRKPLRRWFNGRDLALHFALIATYMFVFLALVKGHILQTCQEQELIYCMYVHCQKA